MIIKDTNMQSFKTKIDGHSEEEFDFECYENTEPIEIGDKYIFFFAGIADVQICDSEDVKVEINQNDRVRNPLKIDFVTGFWRKCFKIKSTNFDLTTV
jgi:hypothetical protein